MYRHSLAMAALLTTGACASAPPRQVSQPIDSTLAVQTFDSAWSRIANTHYDTAFGGVDWKGVRARLRPRAAAARSTRELRAVITEMLRTLGESHYGLIPAEVVDEVGGTPSVAGSSGGIGADVRIIGQDLLVSRVAPEGAAARAGIAPGWSLTHIDGRATIPQLRALDRFPEAQRRTARTTLLYQLNGQLQGESGTTVSLRLRDERGREVERTVQREPRSGEVIRFGNLPPQVAQLHQERLPAPNGCVGLIRFNIWLVPLAAQIDRAVDSVRSCTGIIVDLRGNPGGVAGMVTGVAGHFLTDTLALGFMRTRTSQLRIKANPRRTRADGTPVEPFAGPVAVLVDEMTASTSEFFAAGLQGVGRARIFGTPSAGQALPAMTVRLPNDDVLMHVMADFTGPRAVRIEGRGVIPDVMVTSTRADLLERRDVPLARALAWITATTTAGL